MTQEKYEALKAVISKGYDLKQSIAMTERNLRTLLAAREEKDNYLPEIKLQWDYVFRIDNRLEISKDTTRKIIDLVIDDLANRLEKLKEEFNEL